MKIRLVFFAALFASTVSFAAPVQLAVTVGTPVILADQAQTTYLKISLHGAKPETSAVRAPVNIALVLDRSGSMSGQKIVQARAAAIQVLDYLNAQDILSVIAYDTTVEVVVPATKVTDPGLIAAAIRRLEPRDSTALYAGVDKGAAEVRKFLEKNRVNRVILLSDGLANVGPDTPEALGQLGAALARDGIAVTTLGLGAGYNEDLMVQLARRSDGNHAFVENATDLSRIFAQEFGDVLSVVAQNVEVIIDCAPGVRPKRLLGRSADIQQQRVSTQLNQLYGDQEKYLLLEVETPSGKAESTQELVQVRVTYTDNTSKSQELRSTANARYSASPEAVEKARDAKVMVATVEQIAVEQGEAAVRLRDTGKLEEAEAAFKANAGYLRQEAKKYAAPALEKQSESNARAADSVQSADWDKERKQQRKDQHSIKTQQKY